VNHADGVSIAKTVRYLGSDPECVFQAHSMPWDQLVQRLSVDELHHQVFRANIVQSADVSVIQAGYNFGFPLKALDELRLDQLDGYGTVQSCVASAIDFAHSADADRSNDFVGTELVARRKGHKDLNDFTLSPSASGPAGRPASNRMSHVRLYVLHEEHHNGVDLAAILNAGRERARKAAIEEAARAE
jgi:hypothetical protein